MFESSHPQLFMYSVCIIESLKKGIWYYGSSDNVEQRLSDHNSNRAKYTRFKGPWRLIFQRDFDNKTEALKFEIQLKRMKNKNYIRSTFPAFFLEK